MADRRPIISPIGTSESDVQDFGAGGILNQLPGLKTTGEVERKKALVMNFYGVGKEYSATNPDAISDGDEYGRGDNGSQVGTKTDQITKKTLLYASGNKYKPGMGYDNFNYPEQYH